MLQRCNIFSYLSKASNGSLSFSVLVFGFLVLSIFCVFFSLCHMLSFLRYLIFCFPFKKKVIKKTELKFQVVDGICWLWAHALWSLTQRLKTSNPQAETKTNVPVCCFIFHLDLNPSTGDATFHYLQIPLLLGEWS